MDSKPTYDQLLSEVVGLRERVALMEKTWKAPSLVRKGFEYRNTEEFKEFSDWFAAQVDARGVSARIIYNEVYSKVSEKLGFSVVEAAKTDGMSVICWIISNGCFDTVREGKI